MGKIKLLLAQTESEIVSMITAIAKRDGFDITIVSNGKAAIEKITSEKFDLVICDLTIPEASGCEVACQMSHSAHNSESAFTLLTGDQNPRLIGELFGLDKIDSYVPKPVSFSQISAHIHMMLNTERRRCAVHWSEGLPTPADNFI